MTDTTIAALIDEIDLTLQYFKEEFPNNKQVWNDPVCGHAGGVSPNDLLSIKAALQERPVVSAPGVISGAMQGAGVAVVLRYASKIQSTQEMCDMADPLALDVFLAMQSEAQTPAAAQVDPNMPADELRLHMGELTPTEVLVARSAIRWANSRILDAKPSSEDDPKQRRIQRKMDRSKPSSKGEKYD